MSSTSPHNDQSSGFGADAAKGEVNDRLNQAKDDARAAGDEFRANARQTREDLEAQAARLREDLAGVTDSLRNLAGSGAESARRQAYALRNDVRDAGERYIRQAQETASEFEEQISERVRAEPIKSVLIAAAVGYVYARLFR
ncbi:DUF883 family protein [Aureimonas jatrophae]|jgi:ElaB/YqjD/DUF883 family membrane-anchored ribosome-binding protein|uniref:Membrane-anchored ribosome-binding protein, inhibits growth in stationary phase, ElaB/YqjD/DUF883 family n=1 Tax=Aureimonas jatrophae TaxID=1166073 RepID=A0A1H0EKA0_9HYPH|nr:DUF883 family protein [Aureimonas jatrophae]MBB3950451.1 ElaB/YqjD/DUF883 family membrane-anchored ribosome-binding protein [Aureimonas jatrophae]SDN82917.1 Membrane-anchored ribosome-binding protein, inhibits growth in stationary phase, ElaB/YqjD/DUF883 family [Aureimonas jatrophae]